MKQIIQDFKDLKKARQDVQLAVNRINCFKEKLVQECDEETWRGNIAKEELFDKHSLPGNFDDAVNTLIHVSNYVSTTHKLAQKYRASSCFYKFGEKENQCINLSLNRYLTDNRCEGCDKYSLLQKYQIIFAAFLAAEQKCKKAKQKLLSNFIFWKHKSK